MCLRDRIVGLLKGLSTEMMMMILVVVRRSKNLNHASMQFSAMLDHHALVGQLSQNEFQCRTCISSPQVPDGLKLFRMQKTARPLRPETKFAVDLSSCPVLSLNLDGHVPLRAPL